MSTTPETKSYTIKEVSKLSGLPASTLRYYESIGIIRPIKRDKSSKQRVYSQDDVNMIDALACLYATGLTLDDVRSYIDNLSHGKEGAGKEIELLRAQAMRLEAESQYLELRKRYVVLKIHYWEAVEIDDKDEVERISNEARKLSIVLKSPKE